MLHHTQQLDDHKYLKYGDNLASPRKISLFDSPRILVRQIPSKPPYCINACYLEETILNDRNSMNIVGLKENPYFLLAMLNSKIVSYWFIHKFGKMQRGTFPQFKVNELKLFPIIQVSDEARNSLIELSQRIVKASISYKITRGTGANPIEADPAEPEHEFDKSGTIIYTKEFICHDGFLLFGGVKKSPSDEGPVGTKKPAMQRVETFVQKIKVKL